MPTQPLRVVRTGTTEHESYESRTSGWDSATTRPSPRPATLSAEDFRRRVRASIRIASR